MEDLRVTVILDPFLRLVRCVSPTKPPLKYPGMSNQSLSERVLNPGADVGAKAS